MDTCTNCKKPPETEKVYKCGSGHLICAKCYTLSSSDTSLEKCSNCGNPILPITDKGKRKIKPEKKIKLIEGVFDNDVDAGLNSSKVELRNIPRETALTQLDRNLAGGDSKIVESVGVTTENLRKVKIKHCASDGEELSRNRNKSPKDAKGTSKSAKISKSCQNLRIKPNDNYEVKVAYRNVNFSDSKSTIENISDSSPLDNIVKSCVNKFEEDIPLKALQRPTICPVSDCSKMVALDSLVAHFCFDHNKVPFLPSQTLQGQNLILNLNTLTPCKSHCVAFFLISGKFRSNAPTSYQKNTSLSILLDRYKDSLALPLMAARLPFQHLPGEDFKCFVKSHFAENANNYLSKYTQTSNEHLLSHNKCIAVKKYANHYGIRSNINKETLALSDSSNKLNSGEVLIIWLCGVDNISSTYTVTLKGADTRFFHSYSGRVSSIREQQDSLSVYQQAECLVVQGAAVNRLIMTTDNRNEVCVEVVIT